MSQADNKPQMKTFAVVKGGRCFNSSHRDRGRVIHAVISSDGIEPNGYWGEHAVCGAVPGRKSYGWSQVSLPINCKKCLNKMENSNQKLNPSNKVLKTYYFSRQKQHNSMLYTFLAATSEGKNTKVVIVNGKDELGEILN
jgi:hypothetical protein